MSRIFHAGEEEHSKTGKVDQRRSFSLQVGFTSGAGFVAAHSIGGKIKLIVSWTFDDPGTGSNCIPTTNSMHCRTELREDDSATNGII